MFRKKRRKKREKRKLNKTRIGSQVFFFFTISILDLLESKNIFFVLFILPPSPGPQEAHFGYSYVSRNMLGRGPRWQFVTASGLFCRTKSLISCLFSFPVSCF